MKECCLLAPSWLGLPELSCTGPGSSSRDGATGAGPPITMKTVPQKPPRGQFDQGSFSVESLFSADSRLCALTMKACQDTAHPRNCARGDTQHLPDAPNIRGLNGHSFLRTVLPGERLSLDLFLFPPPSRGCHCFLPPPKRLTLQKFSGLTIRRQGRLVCSPSGIGEQ